MSEEKQLYSDGLEDYDYDYELGDTSEDISSVERELSLTTWKKEAEQIPLGRVTPPERECLIKCIQEQPMTSEETEHLEKILARYRPAITKYKPEETLHNYDQNVQLLSAFDEFMEMTDKQNDIQTLEFAFPLRGKTIKVLFDVYPVVDSQAIMDINNNLELFQDFTQDEMLIYSKDQRDEQMTREELQVLEMINDKLNKKIMQQAIPIATEFLAMQLKFHGEDTSVDDMKTALRRMPVQSLMTLFDTVEKLLHLDEDSLEVFQNTY